MIYLVSDHAGFPLKQSLFELGILTAFDLPITDLNPFIEEEDDYPQKAHLLATTILKSPSKADDIGIAICGSGQGMCIGLNRFNGIRAGLASTKEDAQIMREHNGANVLCLGGRITSPEEAFQIIRIFLVTEPSIEERHVRRRLMLDKISQNDKGLV